MNDGFVFTVGKRRLAVFSLSRLPENLCEYAGLGFDLYIILTPSRDFDTALKVFDRFMCEYIPEPDVLLAVALFFFKIRGLPLNELDIECQGIPVRIKARVLDGDRCLLELDECKLLSTNSYVTASGTELKVSTLVYLDRFFVRCIRCCNTDCVRPVALKELNFIDGEMDALVSAAYSLCDNEITLVGEADRAVSLLLCASLLDASRRRLINEPVRVRCECGICELRLEGSGVIDLLYSYGVEKINGKEG